MGYVYEVVLNGEQATVPIASVFHVWDGDETQSPDDVADVFENNYLPDLLPLLHTSLTWFEILVTGLDVGNLADPIKRAVGLQGQAVGDPLPTGNHVWVKFLSADNGFKAGGKLVPGVNETNSQGLTLTGAFLDSLQLVFDDLLLDLVAAGLALAIYRPVLSLPGLPSISLVAGIVAKGLGSNNRRQRPYQR